MGGMFRVAAIFLATALVIGWPGAAAGGNIPDSPNWEHFVVYEHYDQKGGDAYDNVFLNCPGLIFAEHRHKSYKVITPNDTISCIWMGSSYAVKVFEHGNFEGKSTIFRHSLNLPSDWNDRISSLILFCRNLPEPLGAQLYTFYTGGQDQTLSFIQAPDSLAYNAVQYPKWRHHDGGLYRVVRTSLDVGWRACTGWNFTGDCYVVPDPNNPNDKRLDVTLPPKFQAVHSFELWIISEVGSGGSYKKCINYGKTAWGENIVKCTYAQKKMSAQQGSQAGSLVLPPTPPPPRTAVHPPGGGPATAYHPPVKVPFPFDVTSDPNINRPGLDYKKMPLPAGAPDACRRACLADPRCRAFTYVRPNDRDRRAWCHLKYGVPRPIRSQCCLSGVKTFPRGQASGPAPGPSLSSGVPSQCPPGQYFNPRMRRCVCLPGHWWNARLRRCVPRAAPGQPQVVHRCPPGQYFNAQMRRCVCLPGHWWNARLQRCVPRAQPGRPLVVHRCPPGLWWNPEARRCVRRGAPARPPAAHRCPPGQYWNAGLRRCVCPPGHWWNAGQRRCVRRAAPPPRPAVFRPCPAGQQWSPQAKRCLPVVR
jgi:hypothetical protein